MKTLILILFTTLTFAQSSIVASGNSKITIGEVFPIMQTVQEEKEVTLSTPKFEVLIETPKPIKKKVSFLQSIINFLKTIFKQK